MLLIKTRRILLPTECDNNTDGRLSLGKICKCCIEKQEYT